MNKPKYNIGDEVWMLNNNNLSCHQVLAIVSVEEGNLYGLCLPGNKASDYACAWIRKFLFNEKKLSNSNPIGSRSRQEMDLFTEEKLFPTKEALIASL